MSDIQEANTSSEPMSNGLDDDEIFIVDEGKPVEKKPTKDPKFVTTTRGLYHGDEWISAPFEVVGRARDPNGSGWARLLGWVDPDANKHTYAVSDAKLHGDISVLCGDLAQQGLKIATGANKRALFVAYLNHAEVDNRVTTVTRT